jgi:hypothetical protein
MGEWRYSSTILYLSTREVNGQHHFPPALTPAKESPVPIGKEAVWVADPVWTLG